MDIEINERSDRHSFSFYAVLFLSITIEMIVFRNGNDGINKQICLKSHNVKTERRLNKLCFLNDIKYV